MIRCFWQSRLARAAIICLSVILAIIIGSRGNRPVYVSLIAVALILSIGWMSGTIFGNYLAEHSNQKKLSILHIDLDPARFIREYAHVPEALRPGDANYAITRSYLADGYCAMGQWDQALELLCSDFKDKTGNENLSLKCLYYHNRCNYELQKGNINGASTDIRKLQEAIRTARKENPELAKNMEVKQHIFRCWTDYYEGRKVDIPFLEKQFEESRFNIQRMELAHLLALTCLRDGRQAEAEKYIQFLAEYGKGHYAAAWAREQMPENKNG